MYISRASPRWELCIGHSQSSKSVFCFFTVDLLSTISGSYLTLSLYFPLYLLPMSYLPIFHPLCILSVPSLSPLFSLSVPSLLSFLLSPIQSTISALTCYQSLFFSLPLQKAYKGRFKMSHSPIPPPSSVTPYRSGSAHTTHIKVCRMNVDKSQISEAAHPFQHCFHVPFLIHDNHIGVRVDFSGLHVIADKTNLLLYHCHIVLLNIRSPLTQSIHGQALHPRPFCQPVGELGDSG